MNIENDDVNLFNSVAQSYFALLICFIALSIPASGFYRIILGVLAGLCALSVIIVLFRKRFRRCASFVSGIPTRFVAVALSLSFLGKAFADVGEGWVWSLAALVIFLVGYLFIGLQFGEAYRKGMVGLTKRGKQLGILILFPCLVIGIIVGIAMDELVTGTIFGLGGGIILAIILGTITGKYSKIP